MIDSATRMGFLTFLPFVLIAKGASLPTVGLALTLVFAGGAAGKLVCAFIGARIGVIATVCLTEGLTTVGILALLPLPLEAALVLLPVIGIALNGTSSVLYGSVPELVEPDKRTRAFSIFYTGTIGSGAVAPALYGLLGDAIGVPIALMVVAGICLLTLPLALVSAAGWLARARTPEQFSRQSPSTACTSASAATAAVSARRMRGPEREPHDVRELQHRRALLLGKAAFRPDQDRERRLAACSGSVRAARRPGSAATGSSTSASSSQNTMQPVPESRPRASRRM